MVETRLGPGEFGEVFKGVMLGGMEVTNRSRSTSVAIRILNSESDCAGCRKNNYAFAWWVDAG